MATRPAANRSGAETRTRLLAAAARVFAQHGAAGSTTRRIAAEAGVNEVTLFRLFGSKDALLDAAVHACAVRERPAELPEVPVDPERELAAWCARELARLRRSAELLRQCFAESGERGGHVHEAGAAIAGSSDVLHAYVERLTHRTPLGGPADREAAMTMFVSTIVADALGRDEMPGVYTPSPGEAPVRYARAFLRALGWSASARGAASGPSGSARWEWSAPNGGMEHG